MTVAQPSARAGAWDTPNSEDVGIVVDKKPQNFPEMFKLLLVGDS